MNRKTSEKLKDAWRMQKIYNLDFRGWSRNGALKFLEERKGRELKESEVTPIYMGSIWGSEKSNHTIGVVCIEGGLNDVTAGNTDREPEYFYSMSEMIDVVNKWIKKFPNETLDVWFGYEVLAPNQYGLMDITGDSQLDTKISIEAGNSKRRLGTLF